VVRVENWLLNEIQSRFDKQDINIRFNDNVLIVSDYLCWLASWLSCEGNLGVSFGADSGKSSTLTEIKISSVSQLLSQPAVFRGR
jgi:hypothetical protein